MRDLVPLPLPFPPLTRVQARMDVLPFLSSRGGPLRLYYIELFSLTLRVHNLPTETASLKRTFVEVSFLRFWNGSP